MDPVDFNQFTLCPYATSFFQRLCPVPFPPVSCSFPEPHPDPQCRLSNLLEGQPENRWPSGGKYCIISKPSRYSALHLPCFLQHVRHQHLSVNPLGRATGTQRLLEMHQLASLQRQLGFLRIMFATLGVSPAGRLGPNPYHTSKVTNISLDQISTPLLWNIWFVASYQFVLKPLTNSCNQDPATF